MINNIKALRIPGSGRAMALEAGSASHEFFAAVRVFELYTNYPDHAGVIGSKLFKAETWTNMCSHSLKQEDERTTGLNFCLEALYGSGFYDDPRDKRRTMSNIEESCIAYYDRWPWGKYPIYVQDEDDPNCLVGIEIGMEFVIEFVMHPLHELSMRRGLALVPPKSYAYKYRGRLDGLHRDSNGVLMVQENKTASRLDQAWSMSFLMSHQVTGYCVGSALLTGEACNKGLVKGMAIPLPRSYDYGGLVDEVVERPPHLIAAWMQWVWDTTRIYEQFKDNPDAATRFTHSCNRYFRPCSLLPYCASDDDERETIMGEMEYAPWDPLDDKSKD